MYQNKNCSCKRLWNSAIKFIIADYICDKIFITVIKFKKNVKLSKERYVEQMFNYILKNERYYWLKNLGTVSVRRSTVMSEVGVYITMMVLFF